MNYILGEGYSAGNWYHGDGDDCGNGKGGGVSWGDYVGRGQGGRVVGYGDGCGNGEGEGTGDGFETGHAALVCTDPLWLICIEGIR